MNPQRWYGVRRLYEARFRERVLLGLVVIAALYYVTWSVVQWATLTPAALRFDFVNYFGGAQAAAHGTDIYADFKQSWGTESWVVAYIYPPFFALLLAPLTAFGLVAAARIWLLVVHLAFLVALALILRIHPELSRGGRRLFLLASFTFMPVYLNLKFQQVATVWLLLLVATLWAVLRRRAGLAGIFIAAAASLKVSPIFLIPLFARLGRWRVALLGGVTLVAVTVVSMLAAPGSWQFFTVVLPRIGLGTANWDNGSIDGLVSRIVELAPGLFGGATQAVAKVAIVAAAVIVIGVTLWFARDTQRLKRSHRTRTSRTLVWHVPRHSRRATPGARLAWGDAPRQNWTLRLGVAALITALLIVSSVTWQHHLVTLLLPIATALAWITVRKPGARYGWGLAAAYVMCWIDRRAFPLPADLQVHSPGQGALVLAGTSIKLAGLLVLWLLLLGMLRHEQRMAARIPERPAAGSLAQSAA